MNRCQARPRTQYKGKTNESYLLSYDFVYAGATRRKLMKRSEVNNYIRHAIRFFQSHNWLLPPFAFWTPEQWRQAGPEADEARACRLGWDVTDFCADRFEQFGNLLFTIRNGLPSGQGKPYAEKLMLVREGQHVPLHFHFKKTEDIINRGRGVLTVELYNSTKGNGCGDSAVTVWCDGIR